MRANNDVLLLTWSVLSKEDPDSLEDHKDRKWPFEKVPDVETASLSVILVISSRRILNGIRRRNNEVPSLSRAEGFVSPNKEVTCRRTQCPSLDGCHMILYENIQDNRKCCEMCKGCTYQNKEYASGDQWSSPDDPCVQLSCRSGTIVCDRETCPPITCSYNMTVKSEDSCCRVCPQKDVCIYEGTTYQDSEVWQPNLCTRCSCDDGTTRCRVQQCKVSSWCPAGYVLKYIDGECCPRCVEGKTKIGLHQKLTVKVNRKRIKLPYKNKNPTFSVHRDGNSVIFKAEFGLQVVWDGDSYVELTVSSQYKRRMAGLCGNYNGFGSDDLQGRDHKLYTDSEEFGNTWRVGSKAACVLSHNESEHSSLCDGDKRRRKRAIAACSFLLGSVFSKCRRRVDVRTYYSSCISDMCDCPRNKMCACESFKAYAQACSRENVSIRWEKHILCPSQCPRGAIYRRCTRRCSKTCDEPKKTGYCRDKCQPACICPGKRVLHNGKCIAPHTCPGAPSPSL
uniref:BMP-binding endothelial regulator protein n=1 Tax=Magallana gigas TaxID=29159 RepID=K1QHQ0_MAGGI